MRSACGRRQNSDSLAPDQIRYCRLGREAEAIAMATAIAPPQRTTTTTRAPTIRIVERTARWVPEPESDASGELVVRFVADVSYWLNAHRAPQCGHDEPLASASLTCFRQLEQIGTRW